MRQIFRCQVIAVETTPIFAYLDRFRITKSVFSMSYGGHTPAMGGGHPWSTGQVHDSIEAKSEGRGYHSVSLQGS